MSCDGNQGQAGTAVRATAKCQPTPTMVFTFRTKAWGAEKVFFTSEPGQTWFAARAAAMAALRAEPHELEWKRVVV